MDNKCPVCHNDKDELNYKSEIPYLGIDFYFIDGIMRFEATPLNKIMFSDCDKCLSKMLEIKELEITELKIDTYNNNAIEIGVMRGSAKCLKLLYPYIKMRDIFPDFGSGTDVAYDCLLNKAILSNSPLVLEILLEGLLLNIKKNAHIPCEKFWDILLIKAIECRFLECLKILIRFYTIHEEIQDVVGHTFNLKFNIKKINKYFDSIKTYIEETSKIDNYTTKWSIYDSTGYLEITPINLLNHPSSERLNHELRAYLLQNLSLKYD